MGAGRSPSGRGLTACRCMTDMASQRLLLCRIEDLPSEGAMGFDPEQVGESTVFVIRKGDQIAAYRDLCPHYGHTRLAWKRDNYLSADREHIMCSAHGALFRIDDGSCISGPCMGQHLTALPIEVSGGDIWLIPPEK